MEFVPLLTSEGRQILDLIYKARFSVVENASVCNLGRRYFGFLDKRNKTVIICTENAIKIGGRRHPRVPDRRNDLTPIYINRALRHEAVHVAQFCNNGKTLNLVNINKMKLSPNKNTALENSTKLSGNRAKEYEAYWMEDRPSLVKYALRRFCF